MADTAKTRVINQTIHKSVILISGSSDGTGEASIIKVNISDLPGAPSKVKITRIEYGVIGMNVELKFHRTSGGDVVILSGSGCISDEIEDKGAGLTGDIQLTSHEPVAGGGYTILLEIQAA